MEELKKKHKKGKLPGENNWNSQLYKYAEDSFHKTEHWFF
jgi:hypothetical protein